MEYIGYDPVAEIYDLYAATKMITTSFWIVLHWGCGCLN